MKKLELKHLAHYLPYNLECIYTHTKERGVLRSLYDIEEYNNIKLRINWLDGEHIWMFKPLLRPLSDFENYFSKLFDEDIDVRTFLNEGFITQENQFEDIEDMINGYKVEWWPYGVVQLALRHHFDVFGLIESGLAIDINTIK